MQGRLFTLLGISFPSYFFLLLTGFLFATAIGVLWAKRIGQDPDVIVDLGISLLIAGVIGARLLHVVADGRFWDYVHLCTEPSLVNWPVPEARCVSPEYGGIWDAAAQACHPPQDCFRWAKFWAGGFAYYGGFIGACLAGWFQLKRDRFPFWKAADMAGMVVPLGLSFGRMGCLLAGCCFGAPLASPLGLSFPPNSPASEVQFREGLLSSVFQPSLPVHPTQIYESVISLLISVVLTLWLHGRKRYDGQIFAAFIALYAVARFTLEVWRRDDRGALLGLSTSQLIGVFLLIIAYRIHRVRSPQPLPTS